MASSGQVTISTQSVDWPNYTRGHVWLTNVLNWSVNDSGVISFSSVSSTDNVGGSWRLYASDGTTGYALVMAVQVDYGGGWQTIIERSAPIPTVSQGGRNAIETSLTLIGQLGTAQLSGDCSMRILYYANRAPAPSQSLPNSFPDSGYSEAVQVPVHVDVSWTARVKYNANGGTGAPGDTTKTTSAQSTSVTLSSTRPTRTNHRFEGWANSSSATTPNYQPGGSITIQKSSPTKTIYAVWTEYYRPGEHKVSGQWKSHNRSGGACERKVNGSWVELRTIDGGVGTTDPPSKKANGVWYNQRKVGSQ